MNPASIIRKLNLALLLVALACACALSAGLARTAWAGEDGLLKGVTLAFSGEAASSNDDIKGSNWMSGLSDDVALSDLSIPGTHDAGTWITWDGLFYSICQSLPIGNWEYDYYPAAYPVQDAEKVTVPGQLDAGVRHLDVRVHRSSDGVLRLYHGYVPNTCQVIDWDDFWIGKSYDDLTLDQTMKWVKDFLKDHPTETIILEVANETDNASTDCQLLYDYFQDLAFAQDSIVWWGDHVPTLGEARGKVVLFMNMKGTDQYPQSVYQNGSYYWAVAVSWVGGDEDHRRAAYAFSYNGVDVWSQNKWSDLDPGEKAEYVRNTIYHPPGDTSFAEDTVADNAAKGKKTWFVSYASANTPPFQPPSSYADVVNDMIANDIAYDGSDAFCGILAMDYVTSDLAAHVWKTNYNRWLPTTYSWSEDNSTCTATHSKMSDPSVSESVTVNTTSATTKEPTCTEEGTLTYTADFSGTKWARTQTKDVDIPALGHLWESAEPVGAPRPTRHVWCSREGCSYSREKGFYLQIAAPTGAVYDGEPHPVKVIGRMPAEMEELISVDYHEPSNGASAADGPMYAGKYEARVTLSGAKSISFGGTYSIGKRPVTVWAHDQVVEKGNQISQGTGYVSLVMGAGGYHPVKGDGVSKITLDPQGTVSVGGPITPSDVGIADANGRDVTDSYEISYENGLLVVVDHGTPVFDLPKMKLGMTYDGSERALATPGSPPPGYRMEYALNDNGADGKPADGAWSENMPTGKNAGDYRLWYRVVRIADDNALSPVLVPPTRIPAHIAPRSVDLSWENEFVYDGQPKLPTATVENLVEGDEVSVEVAVDDDAPTAADAPRKVGIYGAKATGLGGASAVNYAISARQARHAFRIVPRPVSIDGPVAQDKEYDGTCDAVLDVSRAAFPELVEGDELKLVECTAAFSDKDVGQGKEILVSDVVLGGADMHEYCYGGEKALRQTASITPREVALSWHDTRFWYDGRAHVPTAQVSGLVEGDECSVDVEGKQVEAGSYTARAVSLSNANYRLPSKVTCDFDIRIAEIDTPFQVVVEDGAPQMASSNLQKVANEVTTDAERGRYMEGEPLMVTLSIKQLDKAAVPASDARPAQDLLDAQQLSEGAWLDIALTKKTAEGTAAISKTDTPVQLALEVPSALQADGRSYALVRSHEGKAAVVSKDSGVMLNAESDEFSTYVIGYSDNQPSPAVPTGDSFPRTLLIAIALLAIASIGAMRFASKRRTDA